MSFHRTSKQWLLLVSFICMNICLVWWYIFEFDQTVVWSNISIWFIQNRKITYHFVTKIFHNTVEVSGLPSIWCNVTFSSGVKIGIRNCSIIVVIWNVFVNTWNIYRNYSITSKYAFNNNQVIEIQILIFLYMYLHNIFS